MELVPGTVIKLAFILAFIYMMLSMFVLHSYESEMKQRPQCVLQLWPFYKEMRVKYPSASKAGRVLVLTTSALMGIWGVSSIWI
mgnify:CR=1 FL=1